jgi:hypothetical protein
MRSRSIGSLTETSILALTSVVVTNRYLSREFSIYTANNVANIIRSVENDELSIDYKEIDILDVFEHYCESKKDLQAFFKEIQVIIK